MAACATPWAQSGARRTKNRRILQAVRHPPPRGAAGHVERGGPRLQHVRTDAELHHRQPDERELRVRHRPSRGRGRVDVARAPRRRLGCAHRRVVSSRAAIASVRPSPMGRPPTTSHAAPGLEVSLSPRPRQSNSRGEGEFVRFDDDSHFEDFDMVYADWVFFGGATTTATVDAVPLTCGDEPRHGGRQPTDFPVRIDDGNAGRFVSRCTHQWPRARRDGPLPQLPHKKETARATTTTTTSRRWDAAIRTRRRRVATIRRGGYVTR